MHPNERPCSAIIRTHTPRSAHERAYPADLCALPKGHSGAHARPVSRETLASVPVDSGQDSTTCTRAYPHDAHTASTIDSPSNGWCAGVAAPSTWVRICGDEWQAIYPGDYLPDVTVYDDCYLCGAHGLTYGVRRVLVTLPGAR